jgi:hypothetical protein
MRTLCPLVLLLLVACHSDPPDARPMRAAQASLASQVCAHLTALGCEQRATCVDERTYHIATRDLRTACLLAAQSQADLLACGTVTCPPSGAHP